MRLVQFRLEFAPKAASRVARARRARARARAPLALAREIVGRGEQARLGERVEARRGRARERGARDLGVVRVAAEQPRDARQDLRRGVVQQVVASGVHNGPRVLVHRAAAALEPPYSPGAHSYG